VSLSIALSLASIVPLSAARRISTIGYCYLSVAIGLRTQANFLELRHGEVRSVPVLLVSVGFLSLLHAQLEGEAGEGFLRGVTAEPRPLFFGNPASSFHPRFTLWCPLETVFIFHELILA
jgi:hypothetical protein